MEFKIGDKVELTKKVEREDGSPWPIGSVGVVTFFDNFGGLELRMISNNILVVSENCIRLLNVAK